MRAASSPSFGCFFRRTEGENQTLPSQERVDIPRLAHLLGVHEATGRGTGEVQGFAWNVNGLRGSAGSSMEQLVMGTTVHRTKGLETL